METKFSRLLLTLCLPFFVASCATWKPGSKDAPAPTESRAADINIAIDNSSTQGGNGDGDLFIVPIRQNFTSRPWNVGETAVIEILTITPETYFYLNLLRTQLQNVGLFAVPPSNVPSNIICINNPDNKVLGFFTMAGRVKSNTILIQ